MAAKLVYSLAWLSLTPCTLETYTGELSQWRKALSASCEVILCGLNMVPESMFHKFIQQLAKITGAKVGTFVSFTDTSNCAKDYPLIPAWQS